MSEWPRMILTSAVDPKKRLLVHHLVALMMLVLQTQLASPACLVGMVRRWLGLSLDLPLEAI